MSRCMVVRTGRPWLCTFVAALLFLTMSCGKSPEEKESQPAQGDGIEASWTGYLSKRYPCSLDMGTAAVKTATQKLNLRVREESAGFMQRRLAVGSDEMSAVIEVNEVTKESTRISVKIGWFGDADASRRILSEVEAEINNLKKQRKFSLGFGGAPPPPAQPQ